MTDYFYRNKDKNGALSGRLLVILILKILLDILLRVEIFSCWMFVTKGGNFCPLSSIYAFYIFFSILCVFNIVFNSSRDLKSGMYWIGIILNSYVSVLSYNHLNFKRNYKKRFNIESYHESTFVRQIIYKTILTIPLLWYSNTF